MAPTIDLDPNWQKQHVTKVDGRWVVDGRPTNSHSIAWHERPSNMPGQAYIGLKVHSPIGAATPPHYHGGAAIVATVIQGKVVNQMVCADGHVIGPNVYEQGESWYEAPGCHHVRCQNVGEEEAVFIAACVVDAGKVEREGVMGALVQIDAQVEEEERAAAGK